MTQYRKNNPQNRNFNQRDRNTHNEPTLRNQQGWREDYEPTPRNEYDEWNTPRTRNQQDRPYDTYDRDRNYQNPRNENYGRNEQYGRNENLGYGQYNFNNIEDRQNPYNGYENERNTNTGYAGHGRYNEDREARNYNKRYETEQTRNQYDNQRDTRNEETTNYGYGNNRQQFGGNENSQKRNSWDTQNEQNRFGTERTQNSESYRGKGPKGYVRSNERITDDINDRLSDDDRIDASGIEVKVENNEVILTGTVNSKEEKRRCEDIVDSISGVNNVENRLRITSKLGSNTNYTEKGQSYRNDSDSEKTNLGFETSEKTQQTEKNKTK